MKKFFPLLVCLFVSLEAKAEFTDVDVTHPYFHSIEALQAEGIVEGHEVEDRRLFFPLSKINRAEALKLILLSTNTEAVLESNANFPDVFPNQWFTDYVNTAFSLNVVQGFPDGNFYPGVKVRRAEFIKMLFEALALPVPEKLEDELWYEPYLILAEEYRLLPAEKDPNGVISRGEAAEIIYRTQQVNATDFEKKYRFAGQGLASYYHESLAGQSTASGEAYAPESLTAAHRTLPLGTRIKVSNEDGEFVVVRVNDRGPYHQQRVLDLSRAAFERLAPLGTGVLFVEFEIFSEPEDLIKAIPEAIRPLLSEETKQA
jgi:rare lipoprotein A